HEVDLYLPDGCRREDAVGDAVVAADTAVRGMDGDVEVVECRVPPRASGRRERAAQRVGAREGPAGLGRDVGEVPEEEARTEEELELTSLPCSQNAPQSCFPGR